MPVTSRPSRWSVRFGAALSVITGLLGSGSQAQPARPRHRGVEQAQDAFRPVRRARPAEQQDHDVIQTAES